jgi:hypothetical protein
MDVKSEITAGPLLVLAAPEVIGTGLDTEAS